MIKSDAGHDFDLDNVVDNVHRDVDDSYDEDDDDDDDDSYDDDDNGSHHRIDSADSLPPVTCAANAPRRGSFWPAGDNWIMWPFCQR